MARRRFHKDQRGFTLIEVLTASLILSIFITGIGAFWITTDREIDNLTLRQRAVFAASSEMERVTTLYDTTGFGSAGPVSTTGYSEVAALPSTRLIYPASLSLYVTGAQDFTTTSANSFNTGDAFQVYVTNDLLPSLNRSYRWVNKAQGVAGRLSWTTTAINPSSCGGGDGCGCLGFLGLLPGSCYRLDLYLEYPYRVVSGSMVAGTNLQTIVLSTIVGRHT